MHAPKPNGVHVPNEAEDAPQSMPIDKVVDYFVALTDQRLREPISGRSDGADAKRISIDDALRYFLVAWPNEGPSRETVRTYRQQLNGLATFARERGQRFVSDLNADVVRSAMGAMRDTRAERSASFKGGEAGSNSLLHATRKFLRWLSDQGVQHVPDLSPLKSQRVPERVQVRLTPEEFRRIQDAILHQLVEGASAHASLQVARDLALIYLLADTGLRAREVVALTTADIDFERVRVRVRRGKGGKERLVSILDPTDLRGGDTIRLLGEWLRARSTIHRAADHTVLFTSVKGWPLTPATLRQILKRICDDARIDGNRLPHAFRRATFTERYRNNPETIDVLAARMGWSDKSHHMVNTYTRGAQLEFAAEVALPSMASMWGGATRLPVAAQPAASTHMRSTTTRSLPRRRSTGSRGNGDALRRLFGAIGDDPELRDALLQLLERRQ